MIITSLQKISEIKRIDGNYNRIIFQLYNYNFNID